MSSSVYRGIINEIKHRLAFVHKVQQVSLAPVFEHWAFGYKMKVVSFSSDIQFHKSVGQGTTLVR